MAMKISATKDGDSHLNKSSSGLFLGVVFVLLLIGILALSLWVSELSKVSKNTSVKVESRLAVLEEQLQLADSTSTEFLSDINTQLQFLDKEIRKLWDLSNKRNKQRIATLEDQLKSIDESIKEIFSQSQEIRLISKEFSKSISDIKTRVAKIDTSSLSSPDYELRIKDLEEAVNSMDSFRRQTNQSILKLKEELSKSISKQENSESNSLPTEN